MTASAYPYTESDLLSDPENPTDCLYDSSLASDYAFDFITYIKRPPKELLKSIVAE